MGNNKIGIADIAKALNISTMSVSRGLSGKSGISESLRDKINQTAKEMGYFKQKSEDELNILVLHQKPFIQDNSNYSAMIQGIEEALQQVNVEYSMEFVDESKQQHMYLPCKLSKGNKFDGVIFVGGFQEEYVEFIKPKIKNQVIYAGYSPSCGYDSVWANFNNNGFKQCEYLIKMGHKDIGFVGNLDFFRNKERLLGISTALEKYNLPVNEEFYLDSGDTMEKNILALLRKEKRPTAVICQWDFTAIKLIKFLHENGITVPQDLSVIGSGNTEMSTLCQPSLTTLDLHIEFSCEAVVALLLRRIANEDKPYENIGINSTLIERDSVRAI